MKIIKKTKNLVQVSYLEREFLRIRWSKALLWVEIYKETLIPQTLRTEEALEETYKMTLEKENE